LQNQSLLKMSKTTDKLIERITGKLKIKYQSPSFVDEIILHLKEKGTEDHTAVNITFEQNDDDFLKINIEATESVEPFLKTLDTLLIQIREKEEIDNEKKRQSEQNNKLAL